MQVFARVVDLGGFSPAARDLRMTPSAVSKLVARLEARLGTRLVNRSTRTLQLTAEGCALYERAVRILADIDEAERAAASGERPAGRIRINTSASYGAHALARLIPEFLSRYPQIALDIVHTDQVVDLLADRSDVAVRAGPMRSSSLVARALGESRLRLVAAPGYLARRGTPASAADLERHDRLRFGYARASEGWPLLVDGKRVTIPPAGPIQASDGEALRHLAVAGAGIARLADFTIRADLAAGRLVPVLEALDPGESEAFHAVYVGQGGPLPARVRALLDFLAEHGRIG
jgi:DNA-binding transcriptional LysR family regulator